MATEKVKTSSLLNKLSFLKENSDSVSLPGKSLTPIYITEKLTQHIIEKSTSKQRSGILAEKQSRIDQYIDEDGINEYLDKIYQRVDIYQDDVGMGNQSFMSPIAQLAPQFYRYFITDTIKEVSPWQIKLLVSPRNKEDVLFQGYLYISLDGKYAVEQAKLSVSPQINLNWVKDMKISLEYNRDDSGRYYLKRSTLGMDLGIFKEGLGVYGEKTLMLTNFITGLAGLDQPLKLHRSENDLRRSKAELLDKLRPEKLSLSDAMSYRNIDSLKKSESFQRVMGIASFFLSGYIGKGILEVGPFNSFYSFNPVEGSRFRFGGRTTDTFSKRIFFDSHLAYGTRDRKWKYSLGTTLSLSPRSIYQFPVSSVTLRHSYETQIPGQDLTFLEEDSFLLSFKRGINDKWLYNRKWLLEFLHETKSHFSFKFGYKNQVLNPAGGLRFVRGRFSEQTGIHDLGVSEFFTEIRWAPHEQFYQGKRFRRLIRNEYPVFTLRGSVGIKGLLNGDYNYQTLTLNIFKRLYLSQFGYSDVIMEAGGVFGKVPFPLLAIHRANQSFAYQLPSYNLMNFMEFMSDRYASVNIEHSFNGFFLNKIPLIKRLQLREIVAVKVLQGGLSIGNDPKKNADLYPFPVDKQGQEVSFSLGQTPYVEGSVGLSNIFKIFRVDLVRRFTYLDHPRVAKWGIRAKLKIDF
ncbi:DUF5686 family protein [Pedobacter sp. KBW06]|uniref:DUF5686 family protein n=1 Tax=Pedobacter sp. KBW06 TaxID=2153359 RepID=UPI003978158F